MRVLGFAVMAALAGAAASVALVLLLAGPRGDALALIGDTSDNVPGVPGIGLNATSSHLRPRAGKVALVSQSAALCRSVLEAPMPSRRLLLPYARPAHAPAYERMFGCPVEFDAGVMEWHFDAAVLRVPCPNANPITAGICAQFCERMFDSLPDETDLSRSIRTACLNSRGEFPNADEMASRLGLSVRTLHRRLAEQGQHYQRIVDDVRRTLAIEFLQKTSLPVEEIAGRVGFSEASNFRKAFRKWTGHAPAHFRA